MRVIGEQDGVPERELKESLSALFVNYPMVTRAYLARMIFGASTSQDIVLAICSKTGVDSQLIDAVGKVFAQQFNPVEHLDMMFLTPENEETISQFCNPFYNVVEQRDEQK